MFVMLFDLRGVLAGAAHKKCRSMGFCSKGWLSRMIPTNKVSLTQKCGDAHENRFIQQFSCCFRMVGVSTTNQYESDPGWDKGGGWRNSVGACCECLHKTVAMPQSSTDTLP